MQVKRILGKDELHITNTCAYAVSPLFGMTSCLFSKYNKNLLHGFDPYITSSHSNAA